MEAAAWSHDEVFRRLEAEGKAVMARHTRGVCDAIDSARRARPYRALYTNAFTATAGRLVPIATQEGRHRLREVYSSHDVPLKSSLVHSDGSPGAFHLWVPILFAVRQWPLVLANVSASAAKESFAPDDARALPPSSYVFAHGMEPGQYIVLDSGEALHTGARIEGVATDVPRAAVVFDYECRRHDGAVV